MQLFTNRPYQHGPSLMVQSLLVDPKSPRSALVYYPLGSGKTLASLHAARVFLKTHVTSKVLVLTTKTNIDDAWKDNQTKYESSEGFTFDDITVKNVEWWFSEENKPLAHYNRLIRLLAQATGVSRKMYLGMTWSTLVREIRFCKSNKKLRAMRHVACTTPNKSFMDVCCPKEYFLIVDECQQYVNNCANSTFVQRLCKKSSFTLLLSATPFDNSTQYHGLCRMLGTCHLENRILYVKPMQHQHVRHRYMGSKMLPDEWQEYVRERRKRQDAYLSRSRQFCNTTSKWRRILRRIHKDNCHRTVVYSFFRERGADGFYDFAMASQSDTVKFRLFQDSSDIQWFHSTSEAPKVLIFTSRAQTGLSLRGVDAFHIMEPQWSSSDEEQAVGRVTRIGARLNPNDPVQVYHWLAQAPNVRYNTADESVFDSSAQKKTKTDRLLASMAVSGERTLQFLLGKKKS